MAELIDEDRAEGSTDISKGAQDKKTLLDNKQPTKVRYTTDRGSLAWPDRYFFFCVGAPHTKEKIAVSHARLRQGRIQTFEKGGTACLYNQKIGA